MDITLPILKNLELKLTDGPGERKEYPSSRLQKGLLLNYPSQDLAEEAVGFGLPVLKCGMQTFFPGAVELESRLQGSFCVVTAVYTINLVEKITKPGEPSMNLSLIYSAKNYLAAYIRHFPLARGFLTSLSSGLRRLFGWETAYEEAGFSARVKMSYRIDPQTGIIAIDADWSDVPLEKITEAIIMDEQGAHAFDQYRDSFGIFLSGKEIGCWDEVFAGEACFVSSACQVAFTVSRVSGARLFRGRELVGSRLAWAGFGYSIPPMTGRFFYTVKIEELS